MTKPLALLPAVQDELILTLESVVGHLEDAGAGCRPESESESEGEGAESVRREAIRISQWLLNYFRSQSSPSSSTTRPRAGSRHGSTLRTGSTGRQLHLSAVNVLEMFHSGLLLDLTPQGKSRFLDGLGILSGTFDFLVSAEWSKGAGGDAASGDDGGGSCLPVDHGHKRELTSFWSGLTGKLQELLFEQSLLDSPDFQLFLQDSGLAWVVVSHDGSIVEADRQTAELYGPAPLVGGDARGGDGQIAGLSLEQCLAVPPSRDRNQPSLFPDTPITEAENFLQAIFEDTPDGHSGLEIYLRRRHDGHGVRHEVAGLSITKSHWPGKGMIARVLLRDTSSHRREESVRQILYGLSHAMNLAPNLTELTRAFLEGLTEALDFTGAILWLYHEDDQSLKPYGATNALKDMLSELKPQSVAFGQQGTLFESPLFADFSFSGANGNGWGMHRLSPPSISSSEKRSTDYQAKAIIRGESIRHRSGKYSKLPSLRAAADPSSSALSLIGLDVLSVPLIFDGEPQGVLDVYYQTAANARSDGGLLIGESESGIDMLMVEVVAGEFAAALARERRLAALKAAEKVHHAVRFKLTRAVKEVSVSSVAAAISHQLLAPARALDRLSRLAVTVNGIGGGDCGGVEGSARVGGGAGAESDHSIAGNMESDPLVLTGGDQATPEDWHCFSPMQWDSLNQSIGSLLELGELMEKELPWYSAQFSAVNMLDVVDNAMADIFNLLQSQRVRVIRRKTDEKLSLVHGNLDALEQVVLALLVNAVEAVLALRAQEMSGQMGMGDASGSRGGHGGGDIYVSLMNNGPMVELWVSDSGIGIPEQAEEMLFKPFYTTRDSIVQNYGKGDVPACAGNQGLGLTIARGILLRHGGSIRFERPSPDHTGCVSRFVVSLPGKDVPSA